MDAELCPSEIQDPAGNIVESGKLVAKTELKMRFGFELESLDVSAVLEIVSRLNLLLSTTSEGKK